MSFIATAIPPVVGAELPISNDPWYPSIDPTDARNVCRFDGTVTPARLHHALIDAIASVNEELDSYRQEQELLGHASLAEVPAKQVNGESVKVQKYIRAVYACLQADLAEAFRDIDTTPQAVGKTERVTEGLEVRIGEYRRNMRWAISDVRRIGRSTVDLI